MKKRKSSFEEYLRKENLSDNTVEAYHWTVEYFNSHYESLCKENLLAYKGYLTEYFKPKTANLRIQAMNKYLAFVGKESLRIK